MWESPYKEIIIALVSGGFVGGLIQFLKFITERIDAKRQEKLEERRQNITEAAELQRIEIQGGEAVEAALWKLLEEKKAEIVALKDELKRCNDGNSLSQPTLTKIYAAVRKLGRQINNLDWLVAKEETHGNLAIEMEILKQNFDELEKILP